MEISLPVTAGYSFGLRAADPCAQSVRMKAIIQHALCGFSLFMASVALMPWPVAAAAAPSAPMGRADAWHLLARTGFGAAPADVERFATLSREAAIDALLTDVRRRATLLPPAWAHRYERVFRPGMTAEQRRAANRREQVERGLELRAWWVAEMLATPTPLTERMTLFWHNHFATSQQKVRVASLMYRQNVLLREHALGNFAVLLREVAKDPAMLVWLDGAQNRRGAPNENFAREVMELFTLGEGRYTEADVREAARALTGWSVDPETGDFRFRRALHDPGVKTIFGRTGPHSGDDLITLLLAQPATAEFITRKLWREFVGEPRPEDAPEITRLAAAFRGSGYELKPLVAGILRTEAFWSPARRGELVKSPVDLVVGTLRTFAFEVEDAAPFAIVLRQLGQDLFAPPNVKGWPGGEAWLSTSTLLARKAFLNRLFRADEMREAANDATEGTDGMPRDARGLIDRDLPGQGRARAQMRFALGTAPAPMSPMGRAQLRGQFAFSATDWAARHGLDLTRADPGVAELLLASPPVQAQPVPRDALASLRALVLDPAYQLK